MITNAKKGMIVRFFRSDINISLNNQVGVIAKFPISSLDLDAEIALVTFDDGASLACAIRWLHNASPENIERQKRKIHALKFL